MEPYITSDTPIELAKSGKRDGTAGNGVEFRGFTRDDIESMVKNWESRGKKEILIELGDHNAPIAAGYLTSIWTESDGDDLILKGMPKWTKRAAEHIVAGELAGMSVEAARNLTDKKSGETIEGWSVLAAALLNRPFFDDLERVSLAENRGTIDIEIENEYRVALSDAVKINKEHGASIVELKSGILERLGLAESVSDDEILTALDGLKEQTEGATELKTEIEAIETETGVKLSDFREKLTAKPADDSEIGILKEQVVQLSEKVGQYEKAETDRGLKLFIESGQKDGRIATTDAAVEQWTAVYLSDPKRAETLLSVVSPSVTLSDATGIDGNKDNKDLQGADYVQLAADARKLAAEKGITIEAAQQIVFGKDK